jgi:aspartyl protease family protein
MRIALSIVVVAGIGIGLALPAAKRAPPPVAVAAVQSDAPVPTHIARSDSGHFLAVADVNSEPIRFVVDTGADTVALTLDDARRAHVEFDPNQFRVIGHGASGDVRGEEVRIAELVLDGKRARDVRAVVLADSGMSLLGQTYLRQIGNVSISNDVMTLE